MLPVTLWEGFLAQTAWLHPSEDVVPTCCAQSLLAQELLLRIVPTVPQCPATVDENTQLTMK